MKYLTHKKKIIPHTYNTFKKAIILFPKSNTFFRLSLRTPHKQSEKAHSVVASKHLPLANIVTLFQIPSKKIYLCVHPSIHFNQPLRFLCKHKHTEHLTQFSPFVPYSKNNVSFNLFYIYCCLSGLNLYYLSANI